MNKIRSLAAPYSVNLLLLFCVFQFWKFKVNAPCVGLHYKMRANQATAQGINDGIVYLMAIPYILVAVAGYAVYRIKSKRNK